MDTPLSSMQEFPILKLEEESENELEIEKMTLLNEELLMDKLKFE